MWSGTEFECLEMWEVLCALIVSHLLRGRAKSAVCAAATDCSGNMKSVCPTHTQCESDVDCLVEVCS